MFYGNATGVQEDQHDDTPIEELRLDCSFDSSSHLFLGRPKGFAGAVALAESGVDIIGPRETC